MRAYTLPLAFLCRAAGSAALAQPKKLLSPDLVEEDGKKVLVFTIGKTDPTVTVGDAKFTFLPLSVERKSTNRGSFHSTYTITNTAKKERLEFRRTVAMVPGDWVAFDQDGEKFRGAAGSASAGSDLAPGETFSASQWFRPAPDAAHKHVVVEYRSKDGVNDLWRIVHPRGTWKASSVPPPGGN